jgi:hypothetical protein
VQEREGNTLELIGVSKEFLNRTQKSQQLKERIDKWDYMKLKRLCTTKEMVTRLKGCPQNGRKLLPVIHLTRD